MSGGLEHERVAVDRLQEGVETLQGIRAWQKATAIVSQAPVEQIKNTRSLDQARARGDEEQIEALLQKVASYEEQMAALKLQILHLESERGLDGLTGVANRRRVDEALRQEWRRCGRLKDPISLIFVDLDEFKGVNDTHGHRAGDALLVGVGQQLQRAMRRAGDVVGRFGGDEFVIILPATTIEEAATVAEKVHSAFNRMEVQFGKLVLRASASIGVATASPFMSGESIEGLFERADKAVYAAKHLGRNRVIAAVENAGELSMRNVRIAEEEGAREVAPVVAARAARR